MNTLVLMGLAGFIAWMVYALIDKYLPTKIYRGAVIVSKHHESVSNTTLNHSLGAQCVEVQKYMLTLKDERGREMLERVNERDYHRAIVGQSVTVSILSRRFTKGLKGFIKYEFKF